MDDEIRQEVFHFFQGFLRSPEFCASILDVQCINRYNNGTAITPILFDLITSSRQILMQDHPSSSTLPSNTHDSETWKAYWKEQGQPWRAAPAIDEERQQQLLSYYQGVVDIERGMYPFKGVRLSRADVEWLLAMEEQRGAELSPRDGRRSSALQSSIFRWAYWRGIGHRFLHCTP